MNKTQLSKKDIKNINQLIEEDYSLKDFLDKKSNIFIMKTEYNVLFVNHEPLFFFYNKKPVPTLKLLMKNNFLKKITIDLPAVKFIVGGADVMRPGITVIEQGIKKAEIISVVDEIHHKPLAVGISRYSSKELETMTSGNVIKNLHHVGDNIWNI
ncbi:DUF1947 domain-containing protein [Candidatus Woesearchaeota archaeon]|nr:DUF1947 domain-containing protein [Candidatus Woesearchaeota archaeon]